MSWKGVVVGVVVAIAIAYTLVFQNPLFMANLNSVLAHGPPPLQVTSSLPSGSSVSWSKAGLAYACSSSGPGILEIKNGANSTVIIVSVSLAYNGLTYNATGTSCSAGPGNTVISITSLGAPPGLRDTSFSGYVAISGGTKFPFSGTWQ
jgi:hypothetical protein